MSRNRILALTLAIVMLCAMLPANVFAAGELSLQPTGAIPEVIFGETEVVEIGAFEGAAQTSMEKLTAFTVTSSDPDVADIAIEHTGVGSGTVVDFAAYAAKADRKKPKEATVEEDGFAVDVANSTAAGLKNDNMFTWKGYGLYLLNSKAGGTLTLTVPVEESGYYALAVSGSANNTGNSCSFAVNGTVMGEYSFYVASKDDVAQPTKLMGGIYLEKGTASVTIAKTGDKNYTMLSKLELVPIGDTVNLNVTGKKIGTTEVTVAATVDGEAVSTVFDLTVKGIPGIFVSLTDAEALDAVPVGQTTTVALDLAIDGLPVSADEIDVFEVELADSYMGTAELVFDGEDASVVINAKAAGTTSVNFTVANATYDEKVISIPMTAKGKEYVYSFFKLQYGNSGGSGYNPEYVEDWSQTTMGDPNEMNAARGVYTDPWIYSAGNMDANLFFVWADQNYGVMVGKAVDAFGSVIIDVDQSGAYTAALDILTYNEGGIAQAYIAPADAGNPMADEYKIGEPIDSYSANAKYKVRTLLGNTYLEAGKYVFSVKMVGQNAASKGFRLGFGNILLLSPTTTDFAFKSDRSVTPVGLTRSVEITATANGIPVSLSDFEDVTVENENGDIVEAVERRDGDRLFLDVTGLAEGKATLNVSAWYHGETEVSTVVALDVVAQDALYGATITAEKNEAEADEIIATEVSVILADDSIVGPDAEGVEVSYETTDGNVLFVYPDGRVKTKNSGKASVVATVTKNGITKTASYEITVLSDSPLASVTLNGLDGIAIDSVAQYSVSGRLGNGMPIPNNATVEYIVVSNDDGAIEVSQSGAIAGIALGSAVVKARVTMPDGTFMDSEEKTITVYDPTEFEEEDESVGGGTPAEVYIDFRAASSNADITPRDHTISSSGWEVDSKRTSQTIMTLDRASFRWQVYGMNVLMYDDVLCLNILIPGDGYYQLSVDGGQYAAGIVAGFYMNGQYLGCYDMYDSGAILKGSEVKMNTVYLKGGVNQLYIKRHAPRITNEVYLYLGSLRFTPVDEMPTKGEVKLGATKTVMSVGESAFLLPGTQLSDGTAEKVGYVGGTYEKDPNNVINSVVASTPSYITMGKMYEITAKAPGTTKYTMSAVINGEPVTGEIEIVVDNQKLGSVTATLADPELSAGDKSAMSVEVAVEDGRKVDLKNVTLSYASSDTSVANVVNGVLETYKEGDVQITVTATMNGKSASGIVPITVHAPTVQNARIKSPSKYMKPNDEGYQMSVIGVSEAGRDMEIPSAVVTWSVANPELVSITEDGFVTPKGKVGVATIEAVVEHNGHIYYPTYELNVREGKTKATYYSEERINAAMKNIEEYDWAKATKDAAVSAGQKWIEDPNMLDYIYKYFVTGNEIPRAATVEFRLDPNAYFCKYCGVDMRKDYGSYGYLHDPINYPWQIQCPECMRRFPSNDFGKFYEAGLNEHGLFDYQLALEQGSQYLVNTNFPEMDEHIDSNTGEVVNEGVHGWGVDDSRGYDTGNTYFYSQVAYMKNYFDMDVPEYLPEKWNFIAYYAHWGLYHVSAKGQAYTALEQLTNAYIYTQDLKYGRMGAILLDRMADLYPDMYIKPWFPYYFNSDSTTPLGTYVGCIWQHGFNRQMVRSYDAFFEIFDDPYVVNYLSKKAKEFHTDEDYYVPDYLSDDYQLYGFEDPNYVEPMKLREGNPKTSGELIRQNIEQNILAKTAEDLYTGQIHGNFGMHQSLAAYTAVVWDTQPYTGELIDWMNASSNDDFIAAAQGVRLKGANFIKTINQVVSRDGSGNEAAPGYNNLWIPYAVFDALAGYEGYAAADQFQNPKVLMMYKQFFPLTLQRRETAAIGDSGAITENPLQSPSMGRPFLATGDVEIGQWLYLKNGNTTEGMHDAIFDDSSMMADMVDEIIAKYGEMDLDKSEQATGFGFSINRGGTKIDDNAAPHDNQRYNYIYYGRNAGHGHQAALDFEMGAYGMKLTADFGYPEAADGGYKNTVWGKGTVNHNLVMVNASNQSSINIGFPLHFDDAGRVKLFDVEAPKVYAATEEYRRTVMMVEVDDDNAYSVDFFRVKGGDDHLYSFHAVSNDVDVSGGDGIPALELIRQSKGTYAGANVEIGANYGKSTNAFDFMYGVRRASYPGSSFQLDFKVRDVRQDMDKPVGNIQKDVHLKMTMLNDFDLTEVALAKGQPPQRDNNPEELELVLARRQGKNLDSLFTTVFEPYQESVHEDGYIASQEVVSMKRVAGPWEDEYDESKALKITLKNGRVDYVVYATNNKITYVVDDRFEFCGFAGVYTLENDAAEEPIYAYVNDGTKIGETEGIAGYKGNVVDFQKDAVLDNYITVKFNGEYDLYNLVGQHIYIENDGVDNGVYAIEGAELLDDGNVKLDLGTITLIRGMVDEYDLSAGYTYNIAAGQAFTIPISTVNDDSPVFDKIGNQIVTVGDTLKIPVNATTKSGAPVTYELAADLPNASVMDGYFYFTPTSTQRGSKHAAVKAVNGSLETTIHFTIEVVGISAGTGGGGGGGGSDEPEEVTYTDLGGNVYVDSDGNVISAGPDKTPGTPDDITGVKKNDDGEYYYVLNDKVYTAGADGFLGTADDEASEDAVAPTEKFVDLGNHAWAKDAIYRLVDAGVIKGVDDTHYAPANQITRADFAILLVRAWDLSADDLGTFEDVAATDYFANEVGIASALGIVNGVGDSKFAPKNPITREQMMVMLARTLEAVKAEVKEAPDDVLADFSDADLISDYAVDAVKSMVAGGFIQGANGKINPQGNATRAEVAVLLDRILNK